MQTSSTSIFDPNGSGNTRRWNRFYNFCQSFLGQGYAEITINDARVSQGNSSNGELIVGTNPTTNSLAYGHIDPLSTGRPKLTPYGTVKTLSRRRKFAYRQDLSDDEPQRTNESVVKRRKVSQPKGQKFACQFFQRSPEAWSHSSSCARSYSNIGKLKEHLKRQHLLELQCHRCWIKFKTKREFEDHIEALPPQPVCMPISKPVGLNEGMSELQHLRIKDRGRYKDAKTDVDKWRMIYGVLFSNELVPSPYWCYTGAREQDAMINPHIESESENFPPAFDFLVTASQVSTAEDPFLHQSTTHSIPKESNSIPRAESLNDATMVPIPTGQMSSINLAHGIHDRSATNLPEVAAHLGDSQLTDFDGFDIPGLLDFSDNFFESVSGQHFTC